MSDARERTADAPDAVTDKGVPLGQAAPQTYQFDEIDLGADTTHARVVELTGRDRHVLELGCASGYMTRTLRDRGCSVVGVELDPGMAREAEEFAERVIVGDLDQLEFDEVLRDEQFDVVVAADVLEHLRDPLRVLRAARRILSPDGHVVVSLPNIAHASVRLALLNGSFPYQERGLLDRTHLRFFTRDSIARLFDEADLAVAEIIRQELVLEASEVPYDASHVPPELLGELREDIEARTYQFVLKALPLERDGLRAIQQRFRELAEEKEAVQREKEAMQRELSELNGMQFQQLREAVAEFTQREADLRSSLIDAHDQLLRRDEEIGTLRAEVEEGSEQASARIAELEREAHTLRVRLSRLLDSPPARLYSRAKDLPGLRQVARRRTEGFERALKSRDVN